MGKRVVAVGRVSGGSVMFDQIAADFGADSDRAAVTPAFAPRLRLNCERCGGVCGDLSDRHPMCFACETETAALAAAMVSEGFANDWRPATALERRRGYVISLRLPGCWQALSARGLQEFADNERWLSQPS